MKFMDMRGLSNSGARWRSAAGAMLAVFFLSATQAVPVGAALSPDWKDAVAQIGEIRDEAILDLFRLTGVYEDYLTGRPSAAEAADELADTHTQMEEVAGDAGDEISSVMGEYPGAPQVQDTGSFALALIEAAKGHAMNMATFRFEEYVDGMQPPPTTTTTLPAVETTTTSSVTTTTAPSTTTTTTSTTTTTTVPPPTTTTVPPRTTTTLPPQTTTTLSRPTATTLPPSTTTTVPPSTTTTVVAPATGGSAPADPPAPVGNDETLADETPALISASGVGDALRQSSRPRVASDPHLFEGSASAPIRPDQRGITASLTRVLEPILPAAVADVVGSPFLVLELLWRAVSSSGRGLVMPVSLLVFSLISLLWDRRSKKVTITLPV